MIKTITSSLELDELLQEMGHLALLVSPNQCSIASVEQGVLLALAKEKGLPLYQADLFQVPRLMSLYALNPSMTSLLIFEKGHLVTKKEYGYGTTSPATNDKPSRLGI
ncbi:hypothetical protein GGG87_06020 [Streptococcus sp. zg-86]|uniref:Uncharacterized protein n=1 Tax=Streptococcus zhangguiae TaxID=2664091 RepID=A0A6I4RGL6_9STRE|nr:MULTISPECIES: hypothetical protein [unclassified Streptococcus]MTB64547.1 hypothetical protein [Streptococcus sp. zg-86]MTB90763.1 hypothetical protein [Streptococcus sp. zg-36]MWV56534.1 hypothetical protein [Streptococcus sp. zg-70]QTH47260.1 hypothetical protein J5M87_06780 [Streptococcus sp. zg-86]